MGFVSNDDESYPRVRYSLRHCGKLDTLDGSEHQPCSCCLFYLYGSLV